MSPFWGSSAPERFAAPRFAPERFASLRSHSSSCAPVRSGTISLLALRHSFQASTPSKSFSRCVRSATSCLSQRPLESSSRCQECSESQDNKKKESAACTGQRGWLLLLVLTLPSYPGTGITVGLRDDSYRLLDPFPYSRQRMGFTADLASQPGNLASYVLR